MTLAEATKKIEDHFTSDVLDKKEFRGEITFSVISERLHDIARFCRDELGFNMLLDVSSVDHFGEEARFEMVYQLYSLSGHISLRLKCSLPELDPKIATVSDLWPTANWHEREVYDMMGITFEGHPDLRESNSLVIHDSSSSPVLRITRFYSRSNSCGPFSTGLREG